MLTGNRSELNALPPAAPRQDAAGLAAPGESLRKQGPANPVPAADTFPCAAAIAEGDSAGGSALAIPGYLQQTYWWAYIHPNGVSFFERQWLVNLILWGNLNRLRDAALDELGPKIGGRTLQVACVYGNFSRTLSERIAPGGSLDVVDVLPIQLRNLRRKLPQGAPVTLFQRDSTALGFPDGSYDQAILFFLLHEQPEAVRRQTLREVLRVLKPGAKLVLVDYHCPGRWHPLRYLFEPVLRALEPYALDLWRNEITEWLPEGFRAERIDKQTSYGGLYQKLVISLPSRA